MEGSGTEASSNSKIAERLAGELDRTTDDYMHCHRKSTQIIREASSGLPSADGQYGLALTSKKLNLAHEKYQRAVKRYRDFVDCGIMPA